MTATNPIITAVAQAAAEKDWPISGVTVVAPLVTGTPLLVVDWAKFDEGDDCVPDPLPHGVEVRCWSRAPASAIDLPPMVNTDGLAIAAAWAHGAWDIKRTSIAAGYGGPLPPYAAGIAQAMREQGYVAWYWRPMLRGPEIRTKQARPDLTLDRWTLGRDGAPPSIPGHPLIPGRETVIRLGDDGTRRTRRASEQSVPATSRQRSYIAILLRQAGEDENVPEDLDKRAASAWIDRLTGRAPPEPSRKARKIGTRITVNQWRMIDFHLRRVGRPGLPPATMMRMTYAEAAEMIAQLSAEQ